MHTEYNPYSAPAPSIDSQALLELYFTPDLTPFDIARRLGVSVQEVIAACEAEAFQKAVSSVKAFIDTRSRHLAAAASNEVMQAVVDGVRSLRAQIPPDSPSNTTSSSIPHDSSPQAPSDPAVFQSTSPAPSRPKSQPIDPRRTLDSLVRALDRIRKAADHPPAPRLARLASAA
jgi:hypothetical protein